LRIFTSYFYQVRFMEPWDIPLSTAVWDPKWFHDFYGQEHIFLDKRKVLNGLRFEAFAPGSSCEGLCRGPARCKWNNPEECAFLQAYQRQLNLLQVADVMPVLEDMVSAFQEGFKTHRDCNIVFLVHEAPDNKCSERTVIQQWFRQRGFDCDEWVRREL